MPSASVKLKGSEKLIAALDALPEKVSARIAKTAVNKAAKPIVKSAKAKAPTRTGLLKLAIGVRSYRSRRNRSVTVAVIGARSNFGGKKVAAIAASSKAGAKARPALYAHLVEFGTAEHWIRAARQGVLSFLGIVTKVVKHPGSRPQRFMRPAFDSNKRRSLRLMQRELWRGIKREASRGT